LLGELLGDEVFHLLHGWAEAHFSAAMVALQFIRDHWVWLPWGLVPITLIIAVVWGTASANIIMRETIVPVERLEDEALSSQIRTWLKNRLSETRLGVAHSFLFGSIVYDHYPTSDVDLAVVLKPTTEKQITRIGREFKNKLSVEFKQTFDHPLHVSFFITDEHDRLATFLAKAGKYESLN
jgi:predicted nucleotidyltransferase